LSGTLQIFHLRNKGHYIPTIAGWLFDEWEHLRPGSNLTNVIKRLANRCKAERIPSVHVAEINAMPVGTISLIDYEMDIRADLNPWVTAVYVHPWYRNRGIGSALMRHIETVAVGLGIENLYLFTPNRQSMYATLGWQVIENLAYHQMDVSIMAKDLRIRSSEGK
jgi:N-acetylglutamate synthase-like GNAT family acetyltransferase